MPGSRGNSKSLATLRKSGTSLIDDNHGGFVCAIIQAKNSYKSNMTGRQGLIKRQIMAMANFNERLLVY